MYISYNVEVDREYAAAVRSKRDADGVTGKERIYLGRVVDKERGVYGSRKRGLFTFDPATGEFGPAPDDVKAPARKAARRARHQRIVAFGDLFLLDSFLRTSGLMDCLDACDYACPTRRTRCSASWR